MKFRSPKTLVAVGLTLAVHALMWWLLQAAPAPSARPTMAARVTTLKLLPLLPLPPLPPPAPPAEPDARPVRRGEGPARPPPTPSFAPIARPPTAVDSVAAALPAEPAASEPLAPPALNLTLPRSRSGEYGGAKTPLREALSDPRNPSTQGSFSERMSRALGTDQPLVEERLNGDSVRLRKGTDCVVISRSRESQLDPFNQSVNPSARGVTPCR